MGRKVFVTSVVAASPKKTKTSTVVDITVSEGTNNSENKEAEIRETATENTQNPHNSSSGSLVTDNNSPDLQKSPMKTSSNMPKLTVEDSDLNEPGKQPISPGIQEKLDLFNIPDKRKAEESPELSKKEKKRLKDQAKAAKKQDDRERVNLILSP